MNNFESSKHYLNSRNIKSETDIKDELIDSSNKYLLDENSMIYGSLSQTDQFEASRPCIEGSSSVNLLCLGLTKVKDNVNVKIESDNHDIKIEDEDFDVNIEDSFDAEIEDEDFDARINDNSYNAMIEDDIYIKNGIDDDPKIKIKDNENGNVPKLNKDELHTCSSLDGNILFCNIQDPRLSKVVNHKLNKIKKADVSDAESVKKKRKVICLEEKLCIINEHSAGATKANISRDHGLNESTVRQILLHKDQYKKQGQSASTSAGFQMTRNRSCLMIEMERLLSVWIEDCNQKQIPLNQIAIKTKALSLFEALKMKENEGGGKVNEGGGKESKGGGKINEGGEKESKGVGKAKEKTFIASSGWLDRYKMRSGIQFIHMLGESACADKKAAVIFPAVLEEIIQKGGYTDERIFNVDETGLFWKKMPNKTYLAKKEKMHPGFKASKDRLTLLLGGNASGDFKLKPMVIYRSNKPRCMRGSKQSLPVHWRSNKKAWMTKTLFEDWFTNCFCPEVEKYCKSQNVDFKILLILDNSPGHPTALNDLCENVQVTFLPPNTTSLIQPMSQGVISTFKAYYLRKTFRQAIDKTTGSDPISLVEFWKNFNIKNAIENINEAWYEIAASNMRVVWQTLIPHCTNDFQGFEVEGNGTIEEIARLGLDLGLTELDNESVEELLQSHDQELNDEDLINLEQERMFNAQADEEEEEEEEEEVETVTKEFTLQELEEIFRIGELFKQKIMDGDPNLERSMKVRRGIENAVRCYKVMYEEKKRRLK